MTARSPLPAPVASAAISVVVAFIYLGIVFRQNHRIPARAAFIALLLLAIAAVFALTFRITGPVARAVLLAGAANSLIVIGFLGLFSIGLPLLVAGAFSVPAAMRALAETPQPGGPAIVAMSSLGAAALIIAGLLATR
jgi:hypothetical protein